MMLGHSEMRADRNSRYYFCVSSALPVLPAMQYITVQNIRSRSDSKRTPSSSWSVNHDKRSNTVPIIFEDERPLAAMHYTCFFVFRQLFAVYIKQRDATLLMNDLYYPLIGSACFGLSPVHHQSSCCVDVHPRDS